MMRYQRWRRRDEARPVCRWKIPNPDTLLDSVLVVKRPDPALWDKVILALRALCLSIASCLDNSTLLIYCIFSEYHLMLVCDADWLFVS